jgi:hypothetical protein
MDGRHARLGTTLDRLPRIPRAAPPGVVSNRLKDGWAAVLGIGWPLTLVVALALEPTPADPEAAPALLAVLGSLALYAALATTAVLAANRHGGAAISAVVGGLLATTFSVTCPLSGHHSFGWWWVAQLGLVVTMLAASLAALGRRARAVD